MSYYLKEPKRLPEGTLLTCRASWDNSDGNPDNPNPGATVREGLQSEEEMMAGFVELGIEASTDSDVWDFFVDAPFEAPAEGSTAGAQAGRATPVEVRLRRNA